MSATPGIDVAAVAAWMDREGLGAGPIEDLARVAGGTQNVMVRFRRGEAEYVLRRGPEHLRPRSNASILRETRVLAALAGSDVPHPTLIATCEDPTVLGDAVFFLMEPVEGFSASLELPERHRSDPRIRHEMGLRIVDALATLGAVDHERAGLAGFGKPAGFLQRQVPRWLGELASYQELAGYPGHGLRGVEEIAGWLEAHTPAEFEPGIMHGDFHAANVMFSRAGPDVVAIVDWEMATIGDPLLDLGWLLATWRLDVPGGFAAELMEAGGLAGSDQLIARYAERSDRDLDSIDWYTVLACFKLGVLLEGTHARAHAGRAPTEVGELLHVITVRLFDRAHRLIEGGP